MSISDALALAHAEQAAGNIRKAEELCRAALRQDPQNPHAIHLLALMAHRQGRHRPAFRLARMAAEAAPDVPEFHNTFGAALGDLRRWGAATVEFRKAIELRPEYMEAHHNLGLAMARAGRPDRAIDAYRRALALSPDNVRTLQRLADALRDARRFGDAAAEYERILATDPRRGDILSELAGAYGKMGRVGKSVALQRKLVEMEPGAAVWHSNLLFTLLHDDEPTAAAVTEAHGAWDGRHGSASPRADFSNDPDPNRRLRLAYISPDFRRHPVAAFVEGALEAHDRGPFELFVYSDTPDTDLTTERIRGLGDAWRDIKGKSDDEVERTILADRIDVLVELTGHTGRNRLRLMSRKPAPVQVTYVGYPATTGLRAIDWRITDDIADPAGESDGHCVERLMRLNRCSLAYRPCGPDESMPDPGPLPALANGYITFASLNRMLKATPTTMRLWAAVLEAVPGSRLLIGAGEEDEGARETLREFGVDLARVEALGRSRRLEYFPRYCRADVALDPFPYAGATTTCDALWMGVPVVSLAGDTHVSRVGKSILTAIGHPEWATSSLSEYVDAVRSLVCHLPRLAQIRSGLRSEFQRSPLGDAGGLARELERAYRDMWREWCVKTLSPKGDCDGNPTKLSV